MINSSSIIDLLQKFSQFKKENIKFLNVKIGDIVNIRIGDDEFDELDENYEYRITMKVRLTEFFSGNLVNLQDAFEMYTNPSGDTHRDIALMMNVGDVLMDYAITDIDLDNLKLVEEGKYVIFEGTVSAYKRIEFKKSSAMYVSVLHTDEVMKLNYFKTISESLRNSEDSDILSVITGETKINSYNEEKVVSQFLSNELDDYQKRAFNIAVNNDVSIIKGPPGTGKSRLITSLIKHFKKENQRVILASQTHAAIDNVIENITVSQHTDNYTGIYWRKSSRNKQNPEFYLKKTMIKRNLFKRLSDEAIPGGQVEKLLKNKLNLKSSLNRFLPFDAKHQDSIFFSTLASSAFEANDFLKERFRGSVLILDEVSKLNMIDVLRFATYASKVILVGDNKQLPPFTDNSFYTKKFLDSINDTELKVYNHLFVDSIFDKIFDEDFEQSVMLENCYRSHGEIVDLYNGMAYQGQINAKGIERPIQFKNMSMLEQKKMSKFIDNNLLVVDTNDTWRYDASLLKTKLELLNKTIDDKENHSIMIMSFKKNHINEVNQELATTFRKIKNNFKTLIRGTVDQLQGQEADFVFILANFDRPPRKNNNYRFATWVQMLQRLNVALSRSKSKIILITDKKSLKGLPIYDMETKTKSGYTTDSVISKMEVWND